MAEKVFDKHEAAEYLGTTEANLFYHHYNSKQLKGGKLRYGRLTWTRAQLDAFKDATPRPGFKERPGVESITVSTYWKNPEYAQMQKDGLARFEFAGHELVSVERDTDNTRLYRVKLWNPTDKQTTVYEFWNNTRLVMTQLDKATPPAVPNGSESS